MQNYGFATCMDFILLFLFPILTYLQWKLFLICFKFPLWLKFVVFKCYYIVHVHNVITQIPLYAIDIIVLLHHTWRDCTTLLTAVITQTYKVYSKREHIRFLRRKSNGKGLVCTFPVPSAERWIREYANRNRKVTITKHRANVPDTRQENLHRRRSVAVAHRAWPYLPENDSLDDTRKKSAGKVLQCIKKWRLTYFWPRQLGPAGVYF